MDSLDTRLDDAADLIVGGHSGSAYDMMRGALAEVSKHHHGSGARAHDNWISALEMLSAVSVAVAMMEKKKTKNLL